jgi:acetylornithine deacetylase
MTLNATERRVLDSLDLDGMIRFIGELVATPSHGGRETRAQRHMAEKLGSLGFDVDAWMMDFSELRRHPEFSMSMPREEGMGVVGTMGGGDRSLILCGHIDTVDPGDPANWTTDPMRATLKEGKLYGRGVCDMKGGLAAALYAVKAVTDSGVKLKGKLIYESCIGEEDGGCGALATCLRGYRADAGVIMEPSEAKVAPEVAGAMSFRATVPGRSAHACVREEGVSAIEKFVTVFNGLRELEAERNSRVSNPLYGRYRTPYALSVGTVQGGQWPGTVPEKMTFEGRLGVAIGETLQHAKAELERKMDEIADADPWLRDHRPAVEWSGYSFAPSRVPLDHLIVRTLAGSYRDATGSEPVYEGMTYASDARLLINVGETPTAVFGPGDVRVAHGADEHVSLAQLEAVARTLALTVLRFLGCEG